MPHGNEKYETKRTSVVKLSKTNCTGERKEGAGPQE